MFRPASPRRPDAGPPLRRPRGKRFVIVASRFNPSITQILVRGATEVLHRSGVLRRNIRLLWAPGAFELPVVAARVANSRPRPDAIVAVGTLIRGETRQYEVLAHAVAQGLTQVSIQSGIPVTFGVVVASTPAQASARAGLPAPRSSRQAGGAMGNRGAEAAMAALDVLRLFDQLKTQSIVHSQLRTMDCHSR